MRYWHITTVPFSFQVNSLPDLAKKHDRQAGSSVAGIYTGDSRKAPEKESGDTAIGDSG